MKRLIVALSIVLAVLAAPAFAQVSKTLSTTTCPVGGGAGCLIFDSAGAGSVGFQITGTFVGTLTLTQTINGTTWDTWTVRANGSTTDVPTISTTGLFFGSLSGTKQVRIAFTDYTSGSAVVSVISAQARNAASTSAGSASSVSGQTVSFSAAITAPDGSGLTPALVSPVAPGNVNNGVHSYCFTLFSPEGETECGAVTPTVTVVNKTINGQVLVLLPNVAWNGQTIQLNIYRTAAGGSVYKLLDFLDIDCTSSSGACYSDDSYVDNIADASLTTTAPTTNTSLGVRWTLVGETFVPTENNLWWNNPVIELSPLNSNDTVTFLTHGTNSDAGDTAPGVEFQLGTSNGFGAGAAGADFDVQAGASVDGNGGDIGLFAGTGGQGGGGAAGGNVLVRSGAVGGGGNSGDIEIFTSGAGDTMTGQAGPVQIGVGNSSAPVPGNTVTISGGSTDAGSPTGNQWGGAVRVQQGNTMGSGGSGTDNSNGAFEIAASPKGAGGSGAHTPVQRYVFGYNFMSMRETVHVGWSTDFNGGNDVGIKRGASGVLKVTDGGSGYGVTDSTGFRVAGVATSLRYLKANGTNYVESGAPAQEMAEFTTSATGTINNLDIGTASIVRFTGGTAITLTGMTHVAPGQVVTLVAAGAGNVFLAHASGSSDADKRLINKIGSSSTPLAASGSGTATYVYDGTSGFWRLVDHQQGAPITTVFSAGDYTGNDSMTWTVAAGDVSLNTWSVSNTLLTWQVWVNTTTVGGTPSTYLQVAVPNGFTLATACSYTGWALDNGTRAAIFTYQQTAGTLGATKITAGNWASSTDNTQVVWNVTCPVS